VRKPLERRASSAGRQTPLDSRKIDDVRVTSFASGSSGNALLIETGAAALLVDCGLPQKTIERHLRHLGLQPSDLSAILLTHEHGDHAHSAGALARRHGIPLVTNHATLMALGQELEAVRVLMLAPGAGMHIGGALIRSFPVPHDAAAPVGYSISTADCCVGVAVDMGGWDDAVVDGLRAADLVVIEANHDRERLRSAPYHWQVKQRIFSPLGHLDNIAAGELLARIADDGRQRSAWLAHLSEQANSPEIALRAVHGVLRLSRTSYRAVAALPRRDIRRWEIGDHAEQQHLFAFDEPL
jgi:phosphoribosyl 1,2-cyclic phosphodiesterase